MDWNQFSWLPRSSTTCSVVRPTASRAMPSQSDPLHAAPQVRWVLHKGHGHQHADHADGDVDVEDPRPAVVVDQPAAQHRPDGGRQHHAHAVDGHRHALLARREGLPQDGQRDGYQSPAADALDRAPQDHLREVLRGACQDGAERKDHVGEEIEPLAPQQRAPPTGHREHDDLRDGVARGHPGDGRAVHAEGAHHVRQRHVHHGDVHHRHERAEHHRGGDDPLVDRRCLDLRLAHCAMASGAVPPGAGRVAAVFSGAAEMLTVGTTDMPGPRW